MDARELQECTFETTMARIDAARERQNDEVDERCANIRADAESLVAQIRGSRSQYQIDLLTDELQKAYAIIDILRNRPSQGVMTLEDMEHMVTAMESSAAPKIELCKALRRHFNHKENPSLPLSLRDAYDMCNRFWDAVARTLPVSSGGHSADDGLPF